MPNKACFSVALITRNEAQSLPNLLAVLKDIDDVIVVDTNSTDDTVKIAKEAGCRVFEVGEKFKRIATQAEYDDFKNKFGIEPSFEVGKGYFHFADARNFALEQCENDWVFQPDADEIPEWDLEKVKAVISDEKVDQLVYRFCFVHNPDGSCALEFSHCKWFRKSKVKWIGWVHELPVTIDGGQRNEKYVDFIYHQHYQLPKAERGNYLPGLELSVLQGEKELYDRNIYYLAREYVFVGEWEKALKMFDVALQVMNFQAEIGQAHIFRAQCLTNLGRLDEAENALMLSVSVCNTRREPYFELGNLHERKGDFIGALSWYLAASGVPFQPHGYINDKNLYGWPVPERIAAMYGKIGNFEKSKQYWLEAVEKGAPDYVKKAGECFGIHKIPKKIFTIWLGDEMPDEIAKCIASQKIHGYEHHIITNENCPKGLPYLDAAIGARKWVKAADYLRLHYLFQNGGIYLDADMQVINNKNFDDMLEAKMFVGKEDNNFLATSVIGSIPGNQILKECLCEMEKEFRGDDDLVFESGMELFTKKVYQSSHDVKIYNSEFFFPYNHQIGRINVTSDTRTFHHFFKSWSDSPDLLPQISILVPHLPDACREEGLEKLLSSIDNLFYPKHLIETLILVDSPRCGVPKRIHEGYLKAKGEYIVYAATDTEFLPDSLITALSEMQRNNKALLAFNTNSIFEVKARECEHFVIRKDLVQKIGGEIFDTEFHHVGVDNLLWAKCDKLKEAMRSEQAKIIHHHFSATGVMDAVHKLGWEKVEQDRALLAKKLAELNGVCNNVNT